ncbi:glutathione S-transferase family protein [Oceanibaculum indicum]|uniref:Glutathione S-transferase n=1 Tax=Oceanibaculum indicum P24 TaxID=1207063 RepID=K2J7B3_9PROT|nr:glutathione S-transferase [Oceanibaculum indicum]EKE78991.1 glutathione S-transferase [Oceanibaculum indicum P24]
MGTEKSPVRLYRHLLSGHCHRVELFLSLLGVPYHPVEVDFALGEHKAPEFLALNPFGQIPVLVDGDVVLADSNAILIYLALTHDPSRRWYPADPKSMASIQRWLSVAAGQLAYGPAAARLVTVFKLPLDGDRATAIAGQLFALLDAELDARSFLLGDEATIADVALYSYTRRAPEGGIALKPYPHIRAWLSRIEALPGFVPMPEVPGKSVE